LNVPGLHELDLLIVRDNTGGIYQGRWTERRTAGGRVVEHTFSYSEAQVRRLMEVAARAAAARRGRLHMILKDGGVPGISDLWREVGTAVAAAHGVQAAVMNVDLAAYELIQRPGLFDVIVAPNMIGDIIADIAGVLVTSRGVTFSGNFSADGKAVYQTNHGCAHDLAGTDRANPGGQILSLAMLLRESFGWQAEAALMERALAAAWEAGWRTADIAEPGCRVVGTAAMAEEVARQVRLLASHPQPDEARVVAG
jgi:3-isopropylmalate dehydrogenase